MNSLTYFNSIKDVFLSAKTIEASINTVLSVDSTSQAGFKLIKKLIIFCTSLSITLLQQDFLQETLSLLKIANKADSELYRYSQAGLTWQGRLVSPIILSFLYLKQNRYTDSLKFLYESHSLTQEINESGLGVNRKIKNLQNFLTFIVLWKIQRVGESEKYLKAVDLKVAGFRGRNFFGLVCAARAAVTAQSTKNVFLAVEICEQALERVEKDDICVDLLKDTAKNVQKIKGTDGDWLINQSFLTVFFITCVIPLIAPATPVLRIHKTVPENLPLLLQKPKTRIPTQNPENEQIVSLTARNKVSKLKNYFNLSCPTPEQMFLNTAGRLNFLSPRAQSVKRDSSSKAAFKNLVYSLDRSNNFRITM